MNTRWFAALAAAVMALAAFNLTYRITREPLIEWDSALYANSAAEMLASGNWAATTTNGTLDYYNSKPPLNVWLVALSLRAFGPSLASIRIASAVSAWVTVLALLIWSAYRFGRGVGLLAGLVLATTFGFLYVHSGRSADPDAAMTLALLAVVLILDASREHPWRRAWLGLPLAAVFMLKGMAVVMPLMLIGVMEWRTSLGTRRERWAPLAVAAVLLVLPVGAWGVARWRVDEWEFFRKLWQQDFVGVSTTVLDDHPGSALFYLNILVKHHYDWILAGITAVILFRPDSWSPFFDTLRFWRGSDRGVLLGSWAAITMLVPSVMQTKLPWYLNPFYPMFALGVAWVLHYGLARPGFPRHHRKLLIAMVVMAAAVSEAKLVYYSHHNRSLGRSVQGLMLSEADRLRGRRVFRASWDRADHFVIRTLVQAEEVEITSVEEFLARSGWGDFLVLDSTTSDPRLELVGVWGKNNLYAKRD